MIKLLPLFLFPLFMLLFSNCGDSKDLIIEQDNRPKFQVEIKATKTTTYCGGAEPTPEIEKSHRTKRAYANTTIYIREDSINTYFTEPYAVVKTDSLGLAKIALPEGEFVFVFENKADENSFNQTLKLVAESSNYRSINELCFRRFYEKPEAKITVSNNGINKVVMHRHFECPWTQIPCAVYVGNLPPSAR